MNILLRLKSEQRGAISLLTLIFLLLVAIVSIVFLWSISLVTGAYNTLYIANQNAAIAAVSAASSEVSQAGQQPAFTCDSPGQRLVTSSSIFCSLPTAGGGSAEQELNSAPAVFAARAVMRNSLANAPFGLHFTGSNKNVQLVPDPWSPRQTNREYVMTFVPSLSRGELRALANGGANCPIPAESYYGQLNNVIRDPSITGVVDCWQIKERRINFAKQYNSGVITRAQAELQFFPNCPIPGNDIPLICGTQRITVAAAATLRQAQPSDSWQDFYYLNP